MSYGIKRDVYLELLRERLSDADLEAEDYNTEIEQIADLRMAYDDDEFEVIPELKAVDEEIIRKAEALGKFIFDEGHYDEEMSNYWVWNPGRIASGEFPVDKIPEHVRELAKSLYYEDLH
jgi:ketosteroid isomerase-like protein